MAEQKEFPTEISLREKRKIRSRTRENRDIWFGFGTFGMAGWSVAVPTVAGIFLGIWLDASHPGRASWTLSFMALGLVIGCALAWYWVEKERKNITKNHTEHQ